MAQAGHPPASESELCVLFPATNTSRAAHFEHLSWEHVEIPRTVTSRLENWELHFKYLSSSLAVCAVYSQIIVLVARVGAHSNTSCTLLQYYLNDKAAMKHEVFTVQCSQWRANLGCLNDGNVKQVRIPISNQNYVKHLAKNSDNAEQA